ncbi:DUF559 domain-containing protein [Catellatospora sp. NPDC049609]|uniref:DUF559 domain-containing protein n=1 Tax=Catellatospora sp. NPDC049609 TaxID=3155505 RepID=UPI00344506A9
MTAGWTPPPAGRVARLRGASTEAVELALTPLPEHAPAVVTFYPPPADTAAQLVACALDELERAALRLFPAWLPGAEHLEGAGGAAPAAVRALARELAATTTHFGPFLADLAERALRARQRHDDRTLVPAVAGAASVPASAAQAVAPGHRFAPEVRAAGLARVLAAGYRREQAALLVDVPDGLTAARQRALTAAAGWLAAHGSFAVWLSGAPLPAAEPVTAYPVRLPAHVTDLVATDDGGPVVRPEPPALFFPPVEGRPRADSAAETALEAALARVAWSAGRVWNRRYPARPHYVIDLVWPAERCAVEIDGAEHRGRHRFAHDRRRDVLLQLDGFAVLRFTNDQVLTELGDVLAHLEQYLRSRRTDAHKE